MASKNKAIAEKVVAEIGGKENVVNAWHCVTRLRFNLNDKKIVDLEAIKKIDGVMGAQFSGDQFQVIIGNKVADVFEEVEELVGSGSGTASNTSGEKQSILSLVMDVLSGIFTPIIPALAGAGLLKGFTALFTTFHWLSEKSDTYAILHAIGDGVFFFLPFFLAVSAARKLKTSEYLSLTLAATMLYPTILDAARGITNVKSFHLFGSSFISLPVVNYSSSVIPIILAVILLKYVYRFVKAWMPESLTFMFTPMLTMVITIPITLWIVGPLGTNIGTVIAAFFAWLFNVAGPLAGLLLAGLMPLIVMTGMHYAFTPIVVQSVSSYGFDKIVQPAMLISNAAQGGAAFAVGIRTKNKAFKQLAFSSGLSAILGITEPAMYGINMKVKRPFYLAMGSSAILGGLSGWFAVKAFGLAGIIGLFSIPVFSDPDSLKNIVIAAILFCAAIVMPFILVLIFGFKDVEADTEAEAATETTTAPVAKRDGTEESIFSPLNGELVPLASVPDQTFATEIMGKGAAIIPQADRVVSPVSGEITVLPESKHAIGIKADNGAEILIHIGIDTVSLQGEHFDALAKVGDRVEVGTPLVSFDRVAIAAKELSTVTMIIVTNTADYMDVLPANESGEIFEGEQLLFVVK